MENNTISRRKALGITSSLFGAAIFGSSSFLSGCRPEKEYVPFGSGDIALLDEIGETIIPATEDSPGARAARIGEFMKTIVEDCYSPEEHEEFVRGIQYFRNSAREKYGSDYSEMSSGEREELLLALEAEAEEQEVHFYRMMKHLTLWGYFTSEPGATQALRYVAVPGRFEGCIPYKPGDKAWA